MHVGIVNLQGPPFTNNATGGTVFAPLVMANNLRALGHAATPLTFWPARRPGKHWHPAYTFVPATRHEALNSFDALVFSPAGSSLDRKSGPWWQDALDQLRRPFVVWQHYEHEAKYQPYEDRFFASPRCRGVLEIVPNLKPRPGLRLPVLTYPAHPIELTALPYQQKRDLVVTGCRLTTIKRVLELVRDAGPGIAANGFDLDVWGTTATWTYVDALEKVPGSWRLRGPYTDPQVPFGPARYAYNAPWLKDGSFNPRVELSTIEAVRYGCCPILNRRSTPSWVTDDVAVLVDPLDRGEMALLGGRLRERNGEAFDVADAFAAAFTREADMARRTADLVAMLS